MNAVLLVLFKCVPLNNVTLAASDKKEYDAFCKKITDIRRVMGGVTQLNADLNNRLRLIKTVVFDAPKVPLSVHNQVYALEKRMSEVARLLFGDATLGRREFETLPSISQRIMSIQYSLWNATSAPSQANKTNYEIASKKLSAVLKDLKAINSDIQNIETELDKAGAPYTPGRVVEWKD